MHLFLQALKAKLTCSSCQALLLLPVVLCLQLAESSGLSLCAQQRCMQECLPQLCHLLLTIPGALHTAKASRQPPTVDCRLYHKPGRLMLRRDLNSWPGRPLDAVFVAKGYTSFNTCQLASWM